MCIRDSCRIGEELFCLHDRGIFLVNGTSVKRVTDIAGAWCCQLVAGHTDLMYVGVYNGIYLVAKKNGEWQVVGKIEGMNDSCRLFEQESDKVIWVYNTDHVTRVDLDKMCIRDSFIYRTEYQSVIRLIRSDLVVAGKYPCVAQYLSLIHIYMCIRDIC